MCNLLSYRGKRSIDYPAPGNPYNTRPPSERRDIWGVGIVYLILRYADLPASFQYLRNQGDIGTHAQALLLKERSKCLFEPVSCRRR